MAQAMIKGMIDGDVVAPVQICCTSAADGTGEAAAERFGINYLPELDPVLEQAETIVLAVKPQQLDQLPDNIAKRTSGKLILSILAGTPLRRLRAKFPMARNIVRAMPNTPGQIGFGVTAYSPDAPLSAEDKRTTEGILGALGHLLAVEERALDAVTG